MAEKTAKELIESLKPLEEALGDSYISLIEDISDSIKPEKDMSKYVELDAYNKVKNDYEELKTKYIQRFENGNFEKPPIEVPKEKEEPVITIDDLFKKEAT